MTQAIHRTGTPIMVEHVPGTAITAGDVVLVGDSPRIAHSDIAASGNGSLAIAGGVYDVVADAVIAAGKLLFWNDTANKVTETPQAGIFGQSVEASTADADVFLAYHDSKPNQSGIVLDAAQQAISGPGAATLTEYYTAWTSTGSNDGTLADGTITGQLKKIQLIVDGGTMTLTPATLTGGSTISFADAGDYCVLRWSGSSWTAVELGNDADGASAPVLA